MLLVIQMFGFFWQILVSPGVALLMILPPTECIQIGAKERKMENGIIKSMDCFCCFHSNKLLSLKELKLNDEHCTFYLLLAIFFDRYTFDS